MKTYYPGETIGFRLKFKDASGKYVSLENSYPVISFYNPAGTKVGDDIIPNEIVPGIYEVIFEIPSSGDNIIGTWTMKITGKRGTWIRKEKLKFAVEQF